MTSPTESSQAPLERDLPCMRCHYNLRTRRPSESCPECNTSVAESIARWTRFGNLRPRLLAIALFSLAATMLDADVASLFLRYEPFDFPWKYTLFPFLGWGVEIVHVAACVMLIFIDGRGSGWSRYRIAMIAVTIATVLMYVILFVAQFVFDPPTAQLYLLKHTALELLERGCFTLLLLLVSYKIRSVTRRLEWRRFAALAVVIAAVYWTTLFLESCLGTIAETIMAFDLPMSPVFVTMLGVMEWAFKAATAALSLYWVILGIRLIHEARRKSKPPAIIAVQ